MTDSDTNAWGHELVIANNEKYCGKILHLNRGAELCMKFHICKTKSWYIANGQFEYKWIDTHTADMNTQIVNIGDIITINIGQPHQLVCLKEGDIFEVGTHDLENDCYYIKKDSNVVQNKKYKNLVLLIHMGLGDHIIMTPAVHEISKQVEKLYIPCKSMYLDALKCIYSDVQNLELLAISSVSNERIVKSELDLLFSELHKKLDGQIAIATTGLYNPKPNPFYPFPSGFYKDLGMDFLSARKTFSWNVNTSIFTSLLQILKQLNIQHMFVHDTSSTKKGVQIGIDAGRVAVAADNIMLNPDRNMYESHHPYYYLAQCAVRTDKINILDYIALMESAHSLYLIDSCYFCVSAFIDTSRIAKKYLYKRTNVKYDWVRDDEWNVFVL